MIKAVIFDMDGVIADSMPLHFEAEKKTLMKYGIRASDDELHKYTGNTVQVKFASLLEANGVNEDVQEVLRNHFSSSHKHIKENVEPVTGFMKLINGLEGHYKLGVVSGSPRKFIMDILKKFKVEGLFTSIISADDVSKGKPHPEGFLKCAGELQVLPAECIVIEDAPAGIKAAKTAGMHAIGLKSAHGTSYDISAADLIVDSLEKLKSGDFKSLK